MNNIENNISEAELKKRIQIAKLSQMELAIEKEKIAIADKARNLCRIDLALEEFDKFLEEFCTMLLGIPDAVHKITNMSPEQYAEIQKMIDDQLERLSQKRIYLSIESTRNETEAASKAVKASQIKSSKING